MAIRVAANQRSMRKTARLTAFAFALGGAMMAIGACTVPPQVLIQNQTEKDVVFWCWDGSPEHVLWQVQVPAYTTVLARLSNSRPAQDGQVYLGILPSFGLAYKEVDSGRTVSKPALLKKFEEGKWRETHSTMLPGPGLASTNRHYFFILTPDDVVPVLRAKSQITGSAA